MSKENFELKIAVKNASIEISNGIPFILVTPEDTSAQTFTLSVLPCWVSQFELEKELAAANEKILLQSKAAENQKSDASKDKVSQPQPK